MDELIQALQIFRKYKNLSYPTHCEHDVMYVVGVEKDEVTKEDLDKLDQLGFSWDDYDDCFYSFKYGSA